MSSVNKLTTRAEIISLIEKIMVDDFETEEESDNAIGILEASVPDPKVTNLIFWPEEELSAEQVYDKAMSYKPIILGHDSE